MSNVVVVALIILFVAVLALTARVFGAVVEFSQ